MAQACINNLPVDIFIMLFDKLQFEEQLALARTCELWYHILSEDRYRRQRRFRICMNNIAYLVTDAEKVQRYRAFRISDRWSLTEQQEIEYLEAVREFLARKEVMSNVEELFLSVDYFPLYKLFGTEARFPKLKRIVDHHYEGIKSDDHVTINAPLSKLKCTASNFTMNPFVQNFFDQIEELDFEFKRQTMMYRTISSGTFTNLNSLTLSAMTRCDQSTEYLSHTYTENERRTFAQLKYLKVRGYAMFSTVNEAFLHLASNLETLILVSTNLSEDAFVAINKMKQLKTLIVLVQTVNYSNVESLCLPNLEKLTTYFRDFVPLGSVPKLRWLCIKGNLMSMVNFWHADDTEKYLRLISQQLEVLHLNEMLVEPWLAKVIGDFKNLKVLEMKEVDVVDSDVCSILHALRTMQSFSMIRCDLTQNPFPNFQRTIGFQRLKDKERDAFFGKLKLEHFNMSIRNIDNEYMRHNYTASFEQYQTQ